MIDDIPIYFVTFADSRLYRTLDRIKKQAEALGIFDGIFINNENTLEKSYSETLKKWANKHMRGYGLWIWKPQVVLEALKKIPDNAILVYADAGCTLNLEGMNRFKQYVKMVKEHSTHRLAFELTTLREEMFTTEYVLQALNFHEPEKRKTDQLLATTFLIQKTHTNISFIESWNNIVKMPHMLTGGLHIPCCSFYRDHRHDQSIWSILNKSMGGACILHDETYFEDGFEKNKHFPIHATRLKY